MFFNITIHGNIYSFNDSLIASLFQFEIGFNLANWFGLNIIQPRMTFDVMF